MSRSTVTAMLMGVLVISGAACKKNENSAKQEAPKTTDNKPATDKKEPAPTTFGASGDIGVQAGGITRDDKEGPAGVLTSVNGTVEVRRLGEPTYAEAKADTKLYPGDVVRTGETSTATIALADESVIEISEVSTVAVASRAGTADPASAAAVLGGVARFTITPRAPAEGAFRVYTSSGVIVTRGTTYGVGVAASGEARVGVESGAVDVIGFAQLDAKPIVVEKTTMVVLAADGKVGATTPWLVDDWGTWRDETDAKIQVVATVDAHSKAMADMHKALIDGYAELQVNADNAATFEATAATSAEKNDPVAYTAVQADGAATIDASFSLAFRLEALTWAYASHAYLATELYVRHPAEVEATWKVAAPRVDYAVLWPKRFEVTTVAYWEPLRFQYYVHHPRGRAHAHLVGIAVPQFYASIQPAPVDPVLVRAKVKGQLWLAPELTYHASARPIWVHAPNANWHASFKVKPAPARAKVAWYVRPATLKGTAMIGAKVSGTWKSSLDVRPPQPRAALAASWKIPVGMKIVVPQPDMSAAASARAKVKIGVDGRLVQDMSIKAPDIKGDIKGKVGGGVGVGMPDVKGKVGGGVGVGGDIKGKVGGGVGVGMPDVKGKVDGAVGGAADIKGKIVVPDVKGGIKVGGGVSGGAGGAVGGGASAGGDAAAKAAADAKAKADAKARVDAAAKAKVEVKPPEVQIKGKASGGFKIGN